MHHGTLLFHSGAWFFLRPLPTAVSALYLSALIQVSSVETKNKRKALPHLRERDTNLQVVREHW